MARTWIHRIIELFYRSAGEEARASFFFAAAVSTNALKLLWSLSDRFEFCHKRGLDTHEHVGDFKEW